MSQLLFVQSFYLWSPSIVFSIILVIIEDMGTNNLYAIIYF